MTLNDDCVHISFRHEDFRATLLQPFLVLFCSVLCVCELFFVFSGNSSPEALLILSPCIIFVLCSIAAIVLQTRYQFGLGPSGIEFYDSLFRRHETAWESIEDIRVVRTAGLEFLQVVLANHSHEISLPLFVTQDAAMREMLLTYTNSSHNVQEKLSKLWG